LDTTFWLGLVIGSVLSLFASSFANNFTPGFSQIVNRQKIGFIEMSRRRAFERYKFLEEFRTGRRDKLLTVLYAWAKILYATVLALGTVILGVVGLFASHERETIMIFAVTTAFALAVLAYSLVCYRRLEIDIVRLENFDEHKRSLKETWGLPSGVRSE
jgi:hypothetical protein